MSTNKFVWAGTELCEQRNNTGATVTKRFFGQGEQISGTNYCFTRDHLGSVREVTDSTGAVRARYDYDPYGRRTKLSGNMDADFGYTGHFMLASQPDHTITLYRLYRPDLGRWCSRDPLAEQAGLNLYAYVRNSPMIYNDPDGRFLNLVAGVAGAIGGGIFGGIIGAVNGGLKGAIIGVLAGAAGGFVGGILLNPAIGAAAAAG